MTRLAVALAMLSSMTSARAFVSARSGFLARGLRAKRGASSSALAAAALENPLLEQSSLPKFGSIEPVHVSPAISSLVEQLEADFSAFEKKLDGAGGAGAYGDVVEELEKLQARAPSS